MASDDRIESRQRVFDGARFSVDRIKLRIAPGKLADREIVNHPGAVVVLGVLEDERVVMIRNERFAVGQTLWELPAGTLEAGEPAEVCAGRELIEETGYEAQRIEPLTTFYTTPGICTERMEAYLATGLHHVGQDLEETERIEVEPLPMDRILTMAERGEIADGKTLATLLYYQTFRRGR